MASPATDTVPSYPDDLAMEDEEQSDLHQEIARSSYADMLHDTERNVKYYAALELAIKKLRAKGRPVHVLDIGTGTGLLSMMASKLGADTITACEGFKPMAGCAREVMLDNGCDKINLVGKHSTELKVGPDGDMKQRATLLVTEVFDSDFIGEGALRTFRHAHENLLEENCIVVPSAGRVYGQVVESELVRRWNRLDPITTGRKRINVPPVFHLCPGSNSVHDIQLSQLGPEHFKTLFAPRVVFSFDWSGKKKISYAECSEIEGFAEATGTANAVFMWWDLTMDTEGTIILSCAPYWAHPSPEASKGPDAIPWRDHWMQEIYHLPQNVSVVADQPVSLLGCHDEFTFWFHFGSKKQLIGKEYLGPLCSCNLHYICSRSRLGKLNDPVRREKYLSVLRKKVNPTSVVLSLGDGSLLGLVAAALGARKVYCIEDATLSQPIIKDIIRYNDMEGQVEVMVSKDVFRIVNQVTLVISEPYYNAAFLPWHNIRFKLPSLRPSCEVMPLVAWIWGMVVQFDHLHKIRTPVYTVCGFKMAKFDRMIAKSSCISDSPIEVQPLWEYGTTALSRPFRLFDFNLCKTGSDPSETEDEFEWCTGIEAPGRMDAVVMWIDYKLDENTVIGGGMTQPAEPGARVVWDKHSRQGVCFNKFSHAVNVSVGDKLSVKAAMRPLDYNLRFCAVLIDSAGKEYNVSDFVLSEEMKF